MELTTLASWLTPTTLFLLLNFTIGTIFFTNKLGSGSKKHQPHQDGFGPGHNHGNARLGRPPSFVDRVKSINFSLYNSPSHESEIHFHGSDSNPNPPPSLLQRVRSFNMPSFKFPQHNSAGDYAAYALTTPDTNRVDPVVKSPEDEANVPTQPTPGGPSLLQRVKSIKLPSLYRSEPEQSSVDAKPERTKSESSKPAMKSKKKKAVKKMTRSASEKVGVGQEEEAVEAVEKRRPETTRVERTTSIDEGEEGVDDKASDFINKFKQQLKLQRLDSFLRYREMLKNN
ncbi:hypothetical protein BRARA_A01607 [Brassica rapa]|uniref:DUF4408 domain-containing protein n=2 Tax=Brassica TaxID=3705 RepID=A0ABQ8EMK9_BRANA|nr:pathogen-associated molecular patterns-induced protein A70-like [Brassica napus]KAH0941933.1 hypothetical protein HID58_001570 [Brassica napus]RID78819.1 hypothetical protein BRARA_A01607 [Brassica rapa]CAG7887693.1 unnamed protein product [Brassica rapa]VDC75193.1 unnamed protein product [Brassica rapa]